MNNDSLCERCNTLSNRWSRYDHGLHTRPLSLIAYVRSTPCHGADQQIQQIIDYCMRHNFSVAQVFEDKGKPSRGLSEALNALNSADGLIAADLERFVEHSDDRIRDLKPLIHHFFCQSNKHLITIKEGIDTRVASGQRNAIEALAEGKTQD